MTWVYEVRDLLNSGHVTNFQKLPINYDLFFQVLNLPTPNPIWVHGSELWSLFGSIKTFVIPRYRHLRASPLLILRLQRPCVHNYPFIKFSMSTSTATASNVSPPKPASTPSSSTSAQVTIPEIPDGYTIFTENTASILLPSTDEAFLNPVQEFNRDMSVACIRVWSDELNQAKEERWKRVNEGGVKVKGKGKKKLKTEGDGNLEKKGEDADVEIKDQSEVSTAVRSYYYLSFSYTNLCVYWTWLPLFYRFK